MDSNSTSVKDFFDKTHLYLSKTAAISMRAQILQQLLGQPDHIQLLDIGCGNGAISLQFLSETNHLTLLDLSDKMLSVARENARAFLKGNILFLNQDFQKWETCSQYDVVICLGVLAHVPDTENALAKLASLTRPGGLCFIQFTDQEKLAAKINSAVFNFLRKIRPGQGYNNNLLRYTDVKALVAHHNLTIEAERRYLFVLPGIDKLPESVLFRYYQFTLRNPFFSRHGIDVIWKLSKASG